MSVVPVYNQLYRIRSEKQQRISEIVGNTCETAFLAWFRVESNRPARRATASSTANGSAPARAARQRIGEQHGQPCSDSMPTMLSPYRADDRNNDKCNDHSLYPFVVGVRVGVRAARRCRLSIVGEIRDSIGAERIARLCHLLAHRIQFVDGARKTGAPNCRATLPTFSTE